MKLSFVSNRVNEGAFKLCSENTLIDISLEHSDQLHLQLTVVFSYIV